MIVAWNPQAKDMGANPYWRVLHSSLENLGVSFHDSPSWAFGRRWAWANRHQVQVLHFHAVQRFWEYEWGQARLRWVVRFVRNLLLARSLGYRTVFTVHDLTPLEHQLRPKWVNYLGHLLAVNLTDAVFVHFESGRRLLAKEYGRKRGVHVVPHPSYIGIYPNDMPRDEARAKFGFGDQERVVVFFGGIRPNKGIESLLSAFRRLPDGDLRLLIAGQPWHPASYLKDLWAQAVGDSRVRIVAEMIADDHVQAYMNASDLVVLPFRQIFTSGSTLLAMSFARSVVVPALGCLPDVVTPETGLLYDPTDPDGLYSALVKALSLDLEAMGKRGHERVARYSFGELARKTIEVYRG